MKPGKLQRSPAAHLWLWLGYALCMALAIPWYRQSGVMDPRWLGMPLWGWCAVAGALGMSLLTIMAVLRLWPDAPTANDHTADKPIADEPTADKSTAEQADD